MSDEDLALADHTELTLPTLTLAGVVWFSPIEAPGRPPKYRTHLTECDYCPLRPPCHDHDIRHDFVACERALEKELITDAKPKPEPTP